MRPTRMALAMLLLVSLWPVASNRKYVSNRSTVVASTQPEFHLPHQFTESSPEPSTTMFPVAVDGAKTPHLIPDAIAHYHFIHAIALPVTPSAAHRARRERELATVPLMPGDEQAMDTALHGVRERLDELAAARQRPPTDAGLDLAELRANEAALIAQAWMRIKTNLSPEGIAVLDAYINDHVKRNIVIYGDWPN